jgi:hypothetical protein
MDEIVKQAMAKWPNVPHCYGWLALDARGQWRLCDEAAKKAWAPGERILNRALLDFINRNYLSDERGCWYFQNGPQRVYVDLEAAPYIARTDPEHGFVLHTGETWSLIDSAWLSGDGELLLQGPSRLALVDDRDLAQCLTRLQERKTVGENRDALAAKQAPAITDEALLDWLASDSPAPLYLAFREHQVPVQKLPYPLRDSRCAAQFGFVRRPRLDAA